MTMRFCILGSGSAGNCALLQTPRARVLIDAGYSARKTTALLASIGESLDRIDAIFLTHEHGDHTAALGGLARHPRIKIFANPSTARVLQTPLKYRPDWQHFETGSRFRYLDLEIQTFSVPHDAQDPVGFIFTHIADAQTPPPNPPSPSPAPTAPPTLHTASSAKRIAWLTDLGHATQHIYEHIRDTDILVVEANHCIELLQADTKRPWSLKQRICGRHGHLSNQATRALLEAVASPRWQHIYLTHLSRDCNSTAAIRLALSGLDRTLPCPITIVEPDTIIPFCEL